MAKHCFGVHADLLCMATSTLSFIVAVNAPFLSFSPLKIREHTGLGCVRQSIPRMVGRGGCGADGSPHWGTVPTIAVWKFLVSLKVFMGKHRLMAQAWPIALGLHLGRRKTFSLKVTNVLPSSSERTREPQRLSPDCEGGEKDGMEGMKQGKGEPKRSRRREIGERRNSCQNLFSAQN
uniref:Uncharacterized protein n=1 Tax=Suricata suricatta TaxID=37032 RepID=A0A673USU8_SURSU